ncbi:phosphoglycolate phosphatase [Antricoccus suffuscus]|uniref:Phosphoglycolate phosphatase n=1 Tax=Antricoccus suffuscus TaxID=1629062 RepID=A0A2T0ZJV4_9ACTN|nr:HAD hydrolase-like protein [Antricoccus suffuscus]PRZ36642.1 phosphoglycolate phosphatase [Antricoccus suffuscus]
MSAPFVIGFDLDMTLIDSRPGMAAVIREINAETGYQIDADSVAGHLGPPLDQLLAPWVPADDRDALVVRFRELYPRLAITPAAALAGAREALEEVYSRGGRAIVITGKYTPNARLHLKHLDLRYDSLTGASWADAKTAALQEAGAAAYVGDHPADMLSAKAAEALAVGVPTGGASRADLVTAGADVVLDSLVEFPGWLDGFLTR